MRLISRSAVAGLTITLLVAASVRAEQRPDFSGVWKLDAKASSAAGGGRGTGSGPTRTTGGGLALGPPPEKLTIRQDMASLDVEYRAGTAAAHLKYRLEGSEAGNTMPVGGRGAPLPAKFTSVWSDATLVTTIVLEPGGQPVREYREIRSLLPDGSMVVEITRRDLPDNIRRSVYRK